MGFKSHTPMGEDQPHPSQQDLTVARVFRVTFRDIDQYTQLVLAADRFEAQDGKGQVVSNIDRRNFHETVECVELVPGTDA